MEQLVQPGQEEELSVTQCAQRRGVSRTAILLAIQRGDLAARKIGNSYAIAATDCDCYQPLTKAEAGRRSGEARRSRKKAEDQPAGEGAEGA